MSDITKVLAPNGVTYTYHGASSRRNGYIYVHGHRVYGTIFTVAGYTTHGFRPVGKWAHLVRAHEVSV